MKYNIPYIQEVPSLPTSRPIQTVGRLVAARRPSASDSRPSVPDPSRSAASLSRPAGNYEHTLYLRKHNKRVSASFDKPCKVSSAIN